MVTNQRGAIQAGRAASGRACIAPLDESSSGTTLPRLDEAEHNANPNRLSGAKPQVRSSPNSTGYLYDLYASEQ